MSNGHFKTQLVRPRRAVHKAPRPYGHVKGVCDWCGTALPRGRRHWCSEDCVREWMSLWEWGTMCAVVIERDRWRCRACGWDMGGLVRRADRLRRIAERRHDPSYGPRRVWGECLGTVDDVRGQGRWALYAAHEAEDADHPAPYWAYRTKIVWHGWVWEFTDAPPHAPHGGPNPELGERITEAVGRIADRHGLRCLTTSWWEFDHVTPMADGGANSLDNLQLLCTPCHRAKTAWEATARAQELPLLRDLLQWRGHESVERATVECCAEKPTEQRALMNLCRLGYAAVTDGRAAITDAGAAELAQIDAARAARARRNAEWRSREKLRRAGQPVLAMDEGSGAR